MNQLVILKSTYHFEYILFSTFEKKCPEYNIDVYFSYRRNFNEELNAQKLVRLVFNGHVLQPDAKTIAACGLFDNCVVHCLIHNPRPNIATEPSQQLSNNQQIPLVNEGEIYFTLDSPVYSIFPKKENKSTFEQI